MENEGVEREMANFTYRTDLLDFYGTALLFIGIGGIASHCNSYSTFFYKNKLCALHEKQMPAIFLLSDRRLFSAFLINLGIFPFSNIHVTSIGHCIQDGNSLESANHNVKNATYWMVQLFGVLLV